MVKVVSLLWVTYPGENGENCLIVMGDLPMWKWWRFHGMEDRARKRTILVDDWELENALKDEGKNRAGKRTIHIDDRGLESALEDEEENRAGKRTILIDGRGSENVLEDEGK